MSDNYIQPGDILYLAVPSGTESGDPVLVNGVTGVALIDRDTDGYATVAVNGVYDLSVKAIDDTGNCTIEVGDPVYINMDDTVPLTAKASGTYFGLALEAVAIGATTTINVLQISVPAAGETEGGRYTLELFESDPVTSLKTGGAAAGATGNENIMSFGKNLFEYHILGTQTILAPSLVASGLNIGMDQTDNDGVEISQGILARNKMAFTIGTDAFFIKATFTIANVSGSDDCALGFRLAEAYQATVDGYNDMAVLNVISGDIKVETILNGGGATTTDTTDNWLDTKTHTLEVYVSAAGVVSYKIDGVAPTAVPAPAFTFDDADVVVPFLYLIQANADQTGVVALQSWECGLQ